jgi:hypothetical protein
MTIERDGSGNRYVDAGNIRVTFVEQSSWTESDGELARPGGNTTGISILATELDGKRQEILMEMVPADNEMAVRFRGSSRPHARNCRCGRPTDRPTLLPHRAYGSVTAPLPLPAYRGDRLVSAGSAPPGSGHIREPSFYVGLTHGVVSHSRPPPSRSSDGFMIPTTPCALFRTMVVSTPLDTIH